LIIFLKLTKAADSEVDEYEYVVELLQQALVDSVG
jgi:hypothetical protein